MDIDDISLMNLRLLHFSEVTEVADICSLPAPRRECLQKMNRTVYYYDPDVDMCLPVTGVCKEERHKFRTMSECLQRCGGRLLKCEVKVIVVLNH